MGNGSSVGPCKTIFVEINGKKERVCITNYGLIAQKLKSEILYLKIVYFAHYTYP